MEEFDFKIFLESVPPGREVLISNFLNNNNVATTNPKLFMHCSNMECDGERFFEIINNPFINIGQSNDIYMYYNCCNCRTSIKKFALGAVRVKNVDKWRVLKYGEVPSFGPPTPSRAITLIGGEKELFLLGRRCENQGMGIGAFVYYRRVIESQKNRIFDELIRVISKISPNDDVLKEIEAAKKETQFTKAVDTIKHALPQSLFINGYNPLTLLHSALSEGVHEHDDAECLEFASSIRTVLFEFADRLGNALKEEANLNEAINKLANKKPKVK
jgi:hypothetical protein